VALSTSEKALAILLGIDEALLKGKGVAARAARASFRVTARGIAAGARYVAPAAPAVGRGVLGAARLYPGTAIAAGLGAAGLAAHQAGYLDPAYEALERERQMAAASYAIAAPTILPELERTYVAPVKRKLSRANKAVKQGMDWLKAGSKASTGALPGKLPAGAFRTSVKAAGMANPKTKSKPGKGKSIMNKLARRLKKWW
jgi:hypothetical protein